MNPDPNLQEETSIVGEDRYRKLEMENTKVTKEDFLGWEKELDLDDTKPQPLPSSTFTNEK